MDVESYIIRNGSKIFEKIFDEFGVNEITDLRLLDQFFERLFNETKGLVIVDFLDTGNWDCFQGYEIDYEAELLTLNWHKYDPSTMAGYTSTSNDYKPILVSLMLHFKDLKIERPKNFPFITIRGYSIKEKEVLKYFRNIDKNTKNSKLDRANFFNIYQVDKGLYIEDCYCYDTPIYSILIIPKDTANATNISSKILFLYNYDNCKSRLLKAKHTLQNQTLDEDELCEKANTIRRVFEFVLKIECCYHRELNDEVFWSNEIDEDDFLFKNSYSDIVLRDLLKILKILKDEEKIKILNSIVVLSNELSHDSGKKVTQEKVLQLLENTLNYTDSLMNIIKL